MKANVELYKGHIEHLSEEVISKYLQYELSSEDMHAVEKHMLNCAFCTEAMEGFETFSAIELSSSSESLQQRLSKRTATNRKFYRLSIAASISILLMFSVFYWSDYLSDKEEMAFSPEPVEQEELIKKDADDNSSELVESKLITIDEVASEDVITFNSKQRSEKKITTVDVAKKEVVKQSIPENEDADQSFAMLDDQEADESDYQVEDLDLIIEEFADEEIVMSGDEVVQNASGASVPRPVTQTIVQQQESRTRTLFSSKSINKNRTGQEQLLIPVEKSNIELDSIDQESRIAKRPEPVGGFSNYSDYLRLKVKKKYPEQALKNKIEGNVVLTMIVTKERKLEDLKVMESLGYGCDELAKDIILNGPLWRSGIQDGDSVSMPIEVTVIFKLP